MAGIPKTKGSIPDAALSAELYATSQAAGYGLSQGEFNEILRVIAAKYTSGQETPANESRPNASTDAKVPADFLRSLKLEDLAIARGCAKGDDRAWEVFLTRYREKLFDSARSITREANSARELADSIYADLYGTGARDGVRVSKLSSYTGRGSLEGWLRTVLAQEWVNRYRKNKRLVSLDEEVEQGAQFATAQREEISEVKSPVIAATDATLAAIAAEDRYILASYFLDKRTLADIARTLGVHESTISRKVEKLAKNVRKQIVERLVRGGMSQRQAAEAMEVDVRDLPIDVGSLLGRQSLEKNAPVPGGPDLSGEMVQEPTKKTFQDIDGKKE